MDEEKLLSSMEQYIDYIESKHWGDMTNNDIDLIRDPKTRKLYRDKVKECIKHVINPLYSSIEKKSRFKFTYSDAQFVLDK